MPLDSYAIVAGFNGTPVNIETISVSGATALSTILSALDSGTHFYVHGVGYYDVPYQFTAGASIQNGYPVKTWTFGVVSTLAYAYFIATYAQGSPQLGKCTVNTTLDTETYVEKNAIVYAPYPNQFVPRLREGLWVYENVEITLRIVGDTA